MFNEGNGISLSDIAAVTRSNNDDGWGGNNGIWVIILLLAVWGRGGFFGYGNDNGGFGGNSVSGVAHYPYPPVIVNGGGYGSTTTGILDQYTLNSDFATLSRQIDSGNSSLERKLDGINNGLCSGFYQEAQLVGGLERSIANTGNNIQGAITQTSIDNMQNTNALTSQITAVSTQLAQCCCDNRAATKDLQYAMATQSNVTDNLVSTNFGNLRYDMAASDCAIKQTVNDVGRNLVDVQNSNTQAILAAIQSIKDDAKDEKIAALQNQVSDMKVIANNNAQTAIFTNAINNAVKELTPPAPVAAFQVNPPFPYQACGCNACG